jgi:hypothetical protein
MIRLSDLIRENNKSQGFLNIINNSNFKNWFGNSKVVDNQGNPMVVFHGTKSPVQKFSKKRTGFGSTILGNYEVERYGIFAAEDSRLANEFVTSGDYDHEENFGHSIIPLFMKIESPLDTIKMYYTDALFNTVEEWGNNHKEWFDNKNDEYNGYRLARILGDMWGSKMWMLFDKDDGNDPEMWISMLKDLDYDGVRLYERSELENNISWVAFEPDQVKSAIGNQGTFNSNEMDIYKESL